MGLFGKRNKYEEDEELEEKRPRRRNRPKDKEFKDLNPEYSKKRKTPPKPWGKRERLTVLITLSLTVLLSAGFYISSRGWRLPFAVNFSNSFSMVGVRDEIPELQGSAEEQRSAGKVVSEFNNKTRGLSGVYGFYILKLDSGIGYGVRQNDVFQAASLIKLPVMVAMYQESEGNRLNLDANYYLKDQDKLKGAGSLSSKPAGYELTYRSVVRLMGKQSDNTAYNIAKKLLGDEKINEVITQAGMQNTSLGGNSATPIDIATFYQKLWDGELVSEDLRDELLEFLTDTIYEDWISSGVEDTRVAHKFGREVNVLNDAGIVFTDSPYILVVMGKEIIEREANNFYPEFSAFIFNEFRGF